MKIKQQDEDFKVEEILALDLKSAGPYRLYRLEKKGIETFALVGYLCRKYKISRPDVGLAGLKDKHALTLQYLTLPEKYGLVTQKEQNFSLEFLGFVDKSLKHGDHEGNRFTLTIRDVRKGELEGIRKKANELSKIGVPNYFDSQRFGSVIKGQFIFKEVLRGNVEQAVKIFLTSYTKSEPKKSKDDKRIIERHWDTLESITVRHPVLFPVLEAIKTTKSWQQAYEKIPFHLKEMFGKAYQSYLWNECVKELLRQFPKDRLQSIPYNAGSLLFFKNVQQSDIAKLPSELAAIGIPHHYPLEVQSIIKNVLQREGLAVENFSPDAMLGFVLAQFDRPVLVHPTEFSLSEPHIDELNDKGKGNHFKLMLSFSLPKGSYATIITKKLFNH